MIKKIIILSILILNSCKSNVNIIKEKDTIKPYYTSDLDVTYKSMGFENYSSLTFIKMNNTDNIKIFNKDSVLFEGNLKTHRLGFSKSFYLERNKNYKVKIDKSIIDIFSKDLNKYRCIDISLSTDDYYKNSIYSSDRKYLVIFTNKERLYR